MKIWHQVRLGTLTKANALAQSNWADLHRNLQHEKSLATASPRNARKMLREYHLLVVVRNPISRIASAFIDKFVREPFNGISAEVIEAIHCFQGHSLQKDSIRNWKIGNNQIPIAIDPSINYEHGITFSEFVYYLEETEDHLLDVHWRPQTCFFDSQTCRPDRQHFCKIEALQTDLRKFELALNMPPLSAPTSHSGSKGKSPSPNFEDLSDVPTGELRGLASIPDVRSLLTPALSDRIALRFDTDFSAFNYKNLSD